MGSLLEIVGRLFERAGKSNREVASYCGCDPSQITRYRTGRLMIPLPVLLRMLDVLGASAAEVVDTQRAWMDAHREAA